MSTWANKDGIPASSAQLLRLLLYCPVSSSPHNENALIFLHNYLLQRRRGGRADKQLRTNYNRNDSVPCIEYTASLFLTNRAHSDNRALSPSSRALSVCQSEAGIARPVTAIAQFPFNFLPLRIGLFNSCCCCCFSWTAYRESAVSKVFGGNLL